MNRGILKICFCIGLIITGNFAKAQTLIHYWHFNNYNMGSMYTPTISPVAVDYSRIASPVAQVLYTGLYSTTGNWMSYLDSNAAATSDYDTVNLRMGATSGLVLRARNQSDSMQLLFYIPTTHYKNILLQYGTQSSGKSGQLHQDFSYSKDSGTTWITSGTGLSSWTDSAHKDFNRVVVHFNDASTYNNAKLVFRVTFRGNTHTAGMAGNNRFDNITVEGDTVTATTVPTTGIASVNQAAYILSPNPVSNILTINSVMDAAKSIVIYNSAGQSVYSSTENSQRIMVSTANFAAGNYVISIRENNTGVVNTMKFVKD